MEWIGMVTGRVQAGFLHTWTRPAGQDPRPGPARLLIGFFFFWGPDSPHRALFSRLGSNLAQPIFIIILSPLRFFARFKPIQGIIWTANSSLLRFLAFFVLRFLAFGPRYMAAKSIQIID